MTVHSGPQPRSLRPPRRKSQRHRLAALPLGLAGLLLGGGTLGGLGFSAWSRLRHSPALGIASVQVRGLSQLDPAPLRALLAPLKGQPLALLETAGLKAQLEALPGVEAAAVSKVLPGTLFIDIRERPGVALSRTEAGLQLVDATGALIGPASSAIRLPEINPADSADLVQAIRLADYAGTLRQQAPRLHDLAGVISAAPGAVQALTRDGVQLLLPEDTAFLAAAEARLAALDLQTLPGFTAGASLDLRFANQVWYRPSTLVPSAPNSPTSPSLSRSPTHE